MNECNAYILFLCGQRYSQLHDVITDQGIGETCMTKFTQQVDQADTGTLGFL
jgi:hypothetical protein